MADRAPVHHKIVFYANDPHALAAFWADAMGYELEDNATLIERVLAAGVASEDDVTREGGRLAWRDAVAIRHPGDEVDPGSGIGLGRRILFERVDEPKTALNRVHLDLHVGRDGMADEASRLTGLGARVLYERNEPRGTFIAMADPEGNEFCLQ